MQTGGVNAPITPSYACTHCGGAIAPQSIQLARQIGTCQRCGHLVDLAPQIAAAQAQQTQAGQAQAGQAAPPRQRIRPPVALPAGLAIREESTTFGKGGTLVVTRRWMRTKHFVMLFLFLAGSSVVAWQWMQNGASTGLIAATVALVALDYVLLSMMVNRTVVRASAERVDVTSGPLPLPLPLGERASAAAQDLQQLYAAEKDGRFVVCAVKKDGSRVDLVEMLITAEQALFIEQQLERVLGLVDFEIPGELGSGLPAAVAGPVPGKGGVVATLMTPLMIAGSVALFFVLGNSEARGTLEGSVDGAPFTFVSASCESGQRAGIVGVELSQEEGERVVRLVRDPVRGDLAIIAPSSEAAPSLVIEGKSCKRFVLDVHGTSTTINDIRVVEGRADLDCEGLSGSVEFEGCH
jgi:DNA-directed RNA polymerase subunit RPC12/RpoP